MSASTLGKSIFEVKAIDDKNKIATPMLSRSGKNVLSLVIWLQAPRQKSAVVGSLLIPEQETQ